MEKTYIFGHRKPDTDSVTAAISLAYLKNSLGIEAEPRVLGSINNETKYVLDYFNVPEPKYLNDVKLQVKDLDYSKGCFLSEDDSIFDCYTYMYDKNFSNIPIVDKKGYLKGIVSLKDVAKDLVDGDLENLSTSYNNISYTLKAEEVLKFDDIINGHIVSPTYRSTTFIENYKVTEETILVVGDRHSIIEFALKSKPKMIILTGGADIKPEFLEIAKEKKVNILKTDNNLFVTSKLITLSNYIKNLILTDNIVSLKENDSVSEFLDVADKQKFSNYPVVDEDGQCLGVLRMADIYKRSPKKVILVDHNEADQSVTGLDEAEIVEIVDHHKIGTIGTNAPINFRNMTVGCTATILYNLYKENGVDIPKEIAGLMMAAIVSDTLLLMSPTTTDLDKKVAADLAKIAGVDMNEFGKEMFRAGSSLKGKTKDEILYSDFKNFTIDNQKVGIGQVSTMDTEPFIEEQQEFIDLINKGCSQNDYFAMGLFVTDILQNGSYVFFNDNAKEIFGDAFGVDDIQQGTFLPDVVSRKKQMVPPIIGALERK